MSVLSSSVSVTRYIVDGILEKPVLETVGRGLTRNTIREVDDDQWENNIGWTSFENPYLPDFEGSSYVIGVYLVFSLRLDKKTIPPKVIQQHYTIEMTRQMKKSGREFLSRNEKKAIKEHVIALLARRIPATPHVYNIIWNIEESWLWFFSNLKAANEALETLFLQSFNLNLVRLFPYTTAELVSDLSEADRDRLMKLTPTRFSE